MSAHHSRDQHQALGNLIGLQRRLSPEVGDKIFLNGRSVSGNDPKIRNKINQVE